MIYFFMIAFFLNNAYERLIPVRGNALLAFKAEEENFFQLIWLTDSQFFSVGWEYKIKCWDKKHGRFEELDSLAVEKPVAYGLAIHPHDRLIFFPGFEKNSVWLTSIKNRRFQNPLSKKIARDDISPDFAVFSFSANGKHLAFGSVIDCTIDIWNYPLNYERKPAFIVGGHERPVSLIRFSNDSSSLASVSDDGVINISDFKQAKKTNNRKIKIDGVSRMLDLAFSENDRFVAVCYNVEIGTTLKMVLYDRDNGTMKNTKISQKFDSKTTVAIITPGLARLISGDADGKVCLWDLANGKLLSAWTLPTRIQAMALSPNGRQIIVGCEKGDCYLIQFPFR